MSRSGTAPVGSPVTVTGLSHEGRGIARVQGKTLFIEDALPGEEVSYRLLRRRKDFDEAALMEVIKAAPERVTPRCAQFGTCGGCVLQHLDPEAQVAAKQQTLADNLRRIGGIEPSEWLAPLRGPIWGYRRRARLSVHAGESGVQVGFVERHRDRVTATERCHILDPKIGELITPLAELFATLSIAKHIDSLEAAIGDTATVLQLQIQQAPTVVDRNKLLAFQDQHGVRFYLQMGSIAQPAPLEGDRSELSYALLGSDIYIAFEPTDFIQVNSEVNRQLVALVMQELDPRTGDEVLDLFAGLGNFTLPLARKAAKVVGIESETGLVTRARRNAEANGLANVEFQQADLFDAKQYGLWAKQPYSHILLDPPRAGAREIIALFPRFKTERIVYVSCHPATLARDAKTLVSEQGWLLRKAGVLDMFPHTAHVESIAVFERS